MLQSLCQYPKLHGATHASKHSAVSRFTESHVAHTSPLARATKFVLSASEILLQNQCTDRERQREGNKLHGILSHQLETSFIVLELLGSSSQYLQKSERVWGNYTV